MIVRAAQLQILVVLDAVLTEGSVTRAAERLNLTQPAVSQTLARARLLFKDPLFVRTNGRMIPTARATALAARLDSWMEATRSLLEPLEFDPATQRRDFVIASNDFAELSLLPPFVAAVRRLAPQVTLSLRSVESASILSDEVREGRVHLMVLGIAPPPTFVEQHLYEEHFVLLARHGHPALRNGFTPHEFAATKQALVSPQGIGLRGPIDEALARLGLSRQLSLSVSRFTSLPTLLADSDLIAAVPSRFARLPETKALCGSAELPFPSPKFTMRLAWHRRFAADPAHLWFRELAFERIQSPWPG
jgi:DNA-binding transcriptional LysR family regulator